MLTYVGTQPHRHLNRPPDDTFLHRQHQPPMSVRRNNAKAAKFSGPRQPHVPRERLTNAQHVPGPGTYNMKSSFGDQTLSKKTSPKRTKFGKEDRDTISKLYITAEQSKKQPSKYTEEIYVGDNKSNSSIGKQVVSSKKTAKSFGFGTSQRDHSAKRYVPKNF